MIPENQLKAIKESFEERAAIVEYDGNLSYKRAEDVAEEIVFKEQLLSGERIALTRAEFKEVIDLFKILKDERDQLREKKRDSQLDALEPVKVGQPAENALSNVPRKSM